MENSPAINKIFVKNGIDVAEMKISKDTLEDYFLKLTGVRIMLSILYSEIVKLKRSLVFIVIPLAAIITAILSGFNAKDWHSALINNAVFWSILMGPAIASLFTGYVFANEYLDKTINNLLAYPYAAYKFLSERCLQSLF